MCHEKRNIKLEQVMQRAPQQYVCNTIHYKVQCNKTVLFLHGEFFWPFLLHKKKTNKKYKLKGLNRTTDKTVGINKLKSVRRSEKGQIQKNNTNYTQQLKKKNIYI